MISLSKSTGKSHSHHILTISSLMLSNILSSVTLYCYFRHTFDEMLTSSFSFSWNPSESISKYVLYMITTLKWVIMHCNLLSYPFLFYPQISFALVMQQTAEARSPSVKKFRDHITSVINDKHQPIITKSGNFS